MFGIQRVYDHYISEHKTKALMEDLKRREVICSRCYKVKGLNTEIQKLNKEIEKRDGVIKQQKGQVYNLEEGLKSKDGLLKEYICIIKALKKQLEHQNRVETSEGVIEG